MSVELRTIEEETWPQYAALLLDTFGGDPSDAEQLRQMRQETELPRAIGAFDGDLLVGTTATMSTCLTVPGGAQAPVAAVTGVAVRPTHRRRGILTRMMERLLLDGHEHGEPVAALWASEAAIYGRFGYGPGAPSTRIRVERAESAFRRPVDLSGVREVGKEAALERFPDIAGAAAPRWPGFVVRPQHVWEAGLADPPAFRRGASRLFLALHWGDERPDGYVAYRKSHSWSESGRRSSKIIVQELLATSHTAYQALWRFCLDIDLFVAVEARARSLDEPLRHLLLDPRALQMCVGEGLWVRPVDVAAALSQRRYAAEGKLVLQLQDGFCPWNEGRYLLEGGPDGACAKATGRDPDLTLDVAALGTVYLGGHRATTLAAAGLIEELRPGALQKADLMLGAERGPWCPTGF